MDPIAQKILQLKEKKSEEERKKKAEEEELLKRKKIIVINRENEFNNLVKYLINRVNQINNDLGKDEVEYEEAEKILRIYFEEFYVSFGFEYIYTTEPEGTQIIVTIGKRLRLNESVASVNEQFYWIPKTENNAIKWTKCNNYHIESDIKSVSIEEIGNYCLEKFVNFIA